MGYNTACEKWIKRYDKLKKIIANHISIFMLLKGSKQLIILELRCIYDKVDLAFQMQKNIILDSLRFYVKIDNEALQFWLHDTVKNNCPTVDEFVKFLNKHWNTFQSWSISCITAMFKVQKSCCKHSKTSHIEERSHSFVTAFQNQLSHLQ